MAAQSPTLPAEISNMSTSNGEWRSMAGVFSTHLSYKGRYNADFTVRADGTTRFGDNNKWGYFPGMSVRWNISDEPWMKWLRKGAHPTDDQNERLARLAVKIQYMPNDVFLNAREKAENNYVSI